MFLLLYQMLPELCLIDDLYQPPVPHLCRQAAATPRHRSLPQQYHTTPHDSDETLIKRRSFGDQFIMSCRQLNTFRRLVELDLVPRSDVDGGERLPVGDLVIVRDDRLPVLGDLLRKLEPETLARLYIVDCRLRVDADSRLQLGRCTALRSLVLSNAKLRRIPECIYEMSGLEVFLFFLILISNVCR